MFKKVRAWGTRRRAAGCGQMEFASDLLELSALDAAACVRDQKNQPAQRIEPSDSTRFNNTVGSTKDSCSNDSELRTMLCSLQRHGGEQAPPSTAGYGAGARRRR
mmetsp:Transcript_28116/g.56346  ORF Transcript_28116/g.56346 Transcript_28116/m.56346 type:complete len:105 (-) Transcript_28116:7-321(-)